MGTITLHDGTVVSDTTPVKNVNGAAYALTSQEIAQLASYAIPELSVAEKIAAYVNKPLAQGGIGTLEEQIKLIHDYGIDNYSFYRATLENNAYDVLGLTRQELPDTINGVIMPYPLPSYSSPPNLSPL